MSATKSAAQAHNMILGQLYTNEIVDKSVLEAVATTDRDSFVPSNLRGASYVDDNLDLGNGRCLLAPLTFTRLLNLAEITAAHNVLVIGCLTGYSAAILSRIAAKVVAIETDADMLSQAKTHLKNAPNVQLQQVNSLAEGYAASGPYDVIVIEGAINFVPDALGLQLTEGGRIVTVFSKNTTSGLTSGSGRGMLIKRLQGTLQYREYFDAAAPVLSGFNRETGFTL
jgi:protein-L-isoaspartate(D-aspartate) O-methyltransferase